MFIRHTRNFINLGLLKLDLSLTKLQAISLSMQSSLINLSPFQGVLGGSQLARGHRFEVSFLKLGHHTLDVLATHVGNNRLTRQNVIQLFLIVLLHCSSSPIQNLLKLASLRLKHHFLLGWKFNVAEWRHVARVFLNLFGDLEFLNQFGVEPFILALQMGSLVRGDTFLNNLVFKGFSRGYAFLHLVLLICFEIINHFVVAIIHGLKILLKLSNFESFLHQELTTRHPILLLIDLGSAQSFFSFPHNGSMQGL